MASMASGLTNTGKGMFKGSFILTSLLFVAILLFVYNKLIHYTDIPLLEPPPMKSFGDHYNTIVDKVVPEKNKKYFI